MGLKQPKPLAYAPPPRAHAVVHLVLDFTLAFVALASGALFAAIVAFSPTGLSSPANIAKIVGFLAAGIVGCLWLAKLALQSWDRRNVIDSTSEEQPPGRLTEIFIAMTWLGFLGLNLGETWWSLAFLAVCFGAFFVWMWRKPVTNRQTPSTKPPSTPPA